MTHSPNDVNAEQVCPACGGSGGVGCGLRGQDHGTGQAPPASAGEADNNRNSVTTATPSTEPVVGEDEFTRVEIVDHMQGYTTASHDGNVPKMADEVEAIEALIARQRREAVIAELEKLEPLSWSNDDLDPVVNLSDIQARISHLRTVNKREES